MHRRDRARGLSTLRRPGRLVGAAFVAGSAATTLGLGAADALRLTGALLRHAPVYGAALVWLVAAPLVLTLALVVRTPWPWVATSTGQLVVVTGLVVRLRHLLAWWAWPALLLAVVVGVASVVLVVAEAQERRSTTTST
ncbi:hypothetical protein ABFT23_05260 [Nocardioides sp. C4-1]|uniref:hypothetical protein n=1 Tax=Nocardioides sp. C4-1 TaxID=3151851 RepID=UPI003265C910